MLLLSAASLMAAGVSAQQLRGPESETDTRECYVTWPASNALDKYVKNWTPGQEITKTYEGNRVAKDGWEDEEFFISRVKLRPLITNTATQIFPEYTGNNDKKLLFWVPCGVSNGYFQTGTLPNGVFDSEVFSSWSYVTHYGNWTSPYGWVPGGFADAAHKHGVLVSGVASVPNASLTGNWQECIGAMGNLTDDEVAKLGDFLRYHGVDGLGYNSEWNSSASYVTNLSAMHGKLVKHMKQYQDNFENPWYAGTGDSGSSPFYECLSSNLYGVFGTSEEPRTIMFLNYNWNTVANINTDKTGIATTGRSPQDLYLGQNMQGGQSSDRGAGYQNEWLTHSEVPYSIGLWGAHSNNMLFPTRVTNGGSDILKQQGYQKVLEQWFTNGKRNPAAKMDITTSKALSPNDNFQGMSRHMSARSAYGWELSDEPFITYFSLGNGNCYRMNGDVAYDNEWYNIGMQDYTPTWRWWWADELLGTGESVPENSMNAEYCWDDAWNGGSSLKISGSTTAGQTQYLHLFKTNFNAFETTKRDTRDLYLGLNMQGGTRPASEWQQHDVGGQAQDYSIGLWGAHSNNMLFPARVNAGGSDLLKQKGYQEVLEQWFTNGKRNPLHRMEVGVTKGAGPTFHGMSRLMNARSAYGWDLSDEPFITYFSLGNGNCYRQEGKVMYDNEWYNIGMQDYTPTWRWWWADKFLGKEEADVPANSMSAEFCWDDAWDGGSSLKISGSTADGETQYLHLFKTQFSVKNNDIITIRYKILKGNGDINFVYSKVGSETEEVTPTRTSIHKIGKDFFYDEWNVVEFKVAPRGATALSSGDWAVLGLKFANAQDLEVLIGEMSIKRGTSNTPQMPEIRSGKILSDVVSGFDAKLFWTMPNSAAAGDPVYNIDVNTSYFELWAQVQGEEPQFMGTTTSWAGLMFKIKNPNHSNRVRLGVQAVSLDHKSKSGISWTSDYLTAPAHEVSEEVAIDKSCIKPGEEFRVTATSTLYIQR
ncbi:uncharacterized protein BN813_02148 [Bacteroides sp. CAG:927]|nr:uncharacterized protein BN813_02148 [Bacteroides sp. CAG:927]